MGGLGWGAWAGGLGQGAWAWAGGLGPGPGLGCLGLGQGWGAWARGPGPGGLDQGGTDGRTDRRTDGWTDRRTKYPLHSTEHRPFGGRCPQRERETHKTAVASPSSLIFFLFAFDASSPRVSFRVDGEANANVGFHPVVIFQRKSYSLLKIGLKWSGVRVRVRFRVAGSGQ